MLSAFGSRFWNSDSLSHIFSKVYPVSEQPRVIRFLINFNYQIDKQLTQTTHSDFTEAPHKAEINLIFSQAATSRIDVIYLSNREKIWNELFWCNTHHTIIADSQRPLKVKSIFVLHRYACEQTLINVIISGLKSEKNYLF